MKQQRILIVDDDRIVCRTLKEQLTEAGYLVSTASSGRVALRLCKQKEFNLAFVNLIMDPIDGMGTIMKLRRIDPEIKFVLMSGHHEELENVSAEFLRQGKCKAVLRKPIITNICQLTKKLLMGKTGKGKI